MFGSLSVEPLIYFDFYVLGQMFMHLFGIHFLNFPVFHFGKFSGHVDLIFDVLLVSYIFDVPFTVQIFKFFVMQFVHFFRGPVGHPFFWSGASLSAIGLRRQSTRPPDRYCGFRCAMCQMRAALIGRSAPCAVGLLRAVILGVSFIIN